MLQSQSKELQVAMLKNMEIYSRQIMTKANQEIAKVVKKNQEMENLLRSLETEKRFLKRIAEERGATTIALHNKLEEEKKRASMVVLNDAESCCGESEEARANKRMRRDDNLIFCLKCKKKFAGVLFLPCRHLSSCKQCEALLQTCPICGMAKKDVIELQSSISY
jgi:E3 ubiquitin-protein ligase BOI and related proteins